MTPPSAAVAETHNAQHMPDAALHEAQQLAMNSLHQASVALRERDSKTDLAAVSPEIDADLAAFMHESLSRRIQGMDRNDPFVITALAVLDRLQSPTQEAIDGALSLINHLAAHDEENGYVKPTHRYEQSEEFPYASWVLNFTPSEKSIRTAIATYRLAKSTRNEEVVRTMIEYFNEFKIDIPQTS
jgi:hypothetical protein